MRGHRPQRRLLRPHGPPGNGNTPCSAICAFLTGGGRTGTCAGEVAIQPNLGQATANSDGVAGYYNYGCGGAGGNPRNEVGAADVAAGYFEYCCCDVN